jgi:hypothetical protein
MPPDAMPPDAMPPDAMPPDAMPPDAMPPDAMPPSRAPGALPARSLRVRARFRRRFRPFVRERGPGPGLPVPDLRGSNGEDGPISA